MDIERQNSTDAVAAAAKPDYVAARDGRLPFAELVRDLDRVALARLTDDLYDEILGILADATDAEVTFVPRDPAAVTGDDVGWTIAHAVAHLTATSEEGAALASSLARGVVPEGRSRSEVPAARLQAAARLRDRLAESRRICQAFLETWPAAPNLDLTLTIVPRFGQLDARGCYALGLSHGDWHLEQLRVTLRQARRATAD